MSGPTHDARQGAVALDGLSIALGSGAQRFTAVRDVSLSIAPGEFVCVLGPSGCGKSTLLGVLAGHIAPAAGRATLDGTPIDGPHPERGMVFQHHTLFPWRRTIDNVAFGLKMRGVGREERRRRSAALLGRVGLADFADRYPSQLSGGMQQRAEIARVMIGGPRILLMDEPFGALDAQTRAMMQALLLDVWGDYRPTVVFVTHDIDEALFLADRIVVMSPGPGTIIEDLRVPFARPRERSETRDLVTEPAFIELKRHLLALLRHREPALPAARLSPLGDGRASPPSSSVSSF
ncbi:ABC transporter ATP-binding protein [Cupriavidus pauculus]|jgi:NitT/TauT family transport system ATP-binding protein|uniref:ABC transporter ATP-binding protein n=1 Tax=Cupriavidus pauculus TaxID=82633 RepID=A0A5P2H1R6_9BURK|nr:ABC transporter ATP-binding protein [Cupriavidus pauculus]QET01831.1 ABC transporter ATP-binding protein [Cupriavidus pauculus]